VNASKRRVAGTVAIEIDEITTGEGVFECRCVPVKPSGDPWVTINYHIPDFFFKFDLNKSFIDKLNSNPDMFYDGVRIASVYGSFPNAIWNGGRNVFGYTNYKNIKDTVECFNRLKIPCRFTWTNSLLEEKHLHDSLCNLIMEIADNGMNEVLVNSPILEAYIRDKYKSFKIISSTTKCLPGTADLNQELEKDYHLVVLDYNLNNNFEFLQSIQRPEKCEILLNAVCKDNCPERKKHYQYISNCQLRFITGIDYDCRCQYEFDKIPQRHSYVSYDDIVNRYLPLGFRHFKIEGRTAPNDILLKQYLHYMVKPNYR
jgi:hypothetical protein